MSTPQEIYLKLRKLHPEDPDEIRAAASDKKKEEDKLRKQHMQHRWFRISGARNLEKAREVRARGFKPKT